MLFQVQIVRIVAYILAYIALALAWHYADNLFDSVYKFAQYAAPALAEAVSDITRIDYRVVEPVMSNKVDLTRALIFFPIALAIFMLLLATLRFDVGRHVTRFAALYIVAHIVLICLWIAAPKSAAAWYNLNEELTVGIFRASGNSKAVTPLVRMAGLYKLFVGLELMLLLSLLATFSGAIARFIGKHAASIAAIALSMTAGAAIVEFVPGVKDVLVYAFRSVIR